MGRSDGSGPSGLVEALLNEHATIRQRFAEVEEAPAEERPAALRRLVSVLSGHEAAEEAVVYPALRACAAGGRAIGQDRLAEQLQAEHDLHDLERTGADGRWFAGSFDAVRAEVLRHAEAEERTVFGVLDANLDHRQLEQLRQQYMRARQRGPTHAHPLSPHKSAATRVTAPVAGILDRLGDVLTSFLPGRHEGGA